MSFNAFADVIVGLDASDVITELDETQEKVRRGNLAMLTAIRQTAQAGILVLQISGAAVDQTLALFVESLIVGIEVASTVAAGTFGITQIFQIGQIIAMITLIRQIKAKRSEAATRTSATVQLLRMGTFRAMFIDPRLYPLVIYMIYKLLRMIMI